ncbi:MAG: crotonase/enoyl-CoA hydratase family protein [Candidatus Pelagadaptatus aseana]|uniref:crotonase/enoyl-CoA hydratase family protein n=1 Tax=Candidatus Pelagadaptatus aseana TaxID=3120508 RepID=UPI0039B23681
MSELLTYTLKGNVAEIELHNGKVNAFSPDFIEAIQGAMDQAEKDEAAVLFIGKPGIFSAGYDLNVMRSGDVNAVADMIKAGSELCARLLAFPRPVVAAVTGHCMAQGVMHILACDYVVGTEGEFTLGLNETQIGMIMPWYGIELAKGRFAQDVINRAVVHAELFDPQGAVDIGLLDKIASPESVLEVARAETQRLAELDKVAFKGSKLRMRAGMIERMQDAKIQDDRDFRQGYSD